MDGLGWLFCILFLCTMTVLLLLLFTPLGQNVLFVVNADNRVGVKFKIPTDPKTKEKIQYIINYLNESIDKYVYGNCSQIPDISKLNGKSCTDLFKQIDSVTDNITGQKDAINVILKDLGLKIDAVGDYTSAVKSVKGAISTALCNGTDSNPVNTDIVQGLKSSFCR